MGRRFWAAFAFVVATASAILAGPRPAAAATNFNVSNSGMSAYIVDGVPNPNLTLTRGQTYTFTVSSSGHPFWITIARGADSAIVNQWSMGVTSNGASPGTVTFTVPDAAPGTLFYQCGAHDPMGGTLNIVTTTADVPINGPFTLAALIASILLVAAARVRRSAPRA
jgi:plastocyanin